MLKSSGDLPERPGIYIFRSAAGKALYIGKAVDLRRRIGQYFQKKNDPLIRRLLERSAALETIVTESEADALLLESNLVHSCQPPFNIRLKDDKSFPFIEITLGEEFPGIFYSRRIGSGSFALGPLVNARKARDLIDAVTRLFRLRTCSTALLRRGIPCLFHHIDRCSAPCAGNIGQRSYRRRVQDAVDLLSGRKGRVAARFRRRMRSLAARLDFEGAQKAKEDLQLLDEISPRSCLGARGRGESDVLAACLVGREAFFAHFALRSGRVTRSDFFHLASVQDSEAEAFREFLIGFYRLRPLPTEIIVSRLPAQADGLSALFSDQAGRCVRIRTARRGSKRKIVELAMENLALFVRRSDYRSLGEEMRRELGLRNFPSRIEGFDISHLGEKNRVGAMVTFQDGRPEKHRYRSYLVRDAAPGDSEALGEVLRRRFAKAVPPRCDGDSPAPDLLLIDGGLPQLGAARKVKADLGLSCDLLALAKEEERLFLEDGTSLVPEPGSPLRLLLQHVRDEAHRRAVSHHRRRRERLPVS
ncbi:MAG: excinuclease ABC subunit UvrC [Candidatus Aminicenantes bacterium]|nr:excinuclease ABC subunit UvrC [Candidatus Aminicenantes bacterium]